MKSLLLQTVVCLSIAFNSDPLLAASPKEQPYGGLIPGRKFTLKVVEVKATKTFHGKTTKNVPIPQGIVKFKSGQKIEFKIGASGQLTGPGLSMQYVRTTIIPGGPEGPLTSGTNEYRSLKSTTAGKGVIFFFEEPEKPHVGIGSFSFTKRINPGPNESTFEVTYHLGEIIPALPRL